MACNGGQGGHGAGQSRPALGLDPGHAGHGAGHGDTHRIHGRPAGPVSVAASAAGEAAFRIPYQGLEVEN